MPTAGENGNLNSASNDLAGSGWNETPGRLILAQIDHLSGEEYFLKGLPNKVVPRVTLKPDEGAEIKEQLLIGALPVMEAALAAHTTINGTVPAAVAAAMGLMDPDEAAEQAQEAAYLSGGVPGLKAAAREVAERALLISRVMAEELGA